MPVCKLCRKDKKLINAHIIPKSFCKFLSEDEPLKIYSSQPNFHPKKSPIGEYDSTILCESCERRFSAWDDYAYQLLLLSKPQEEVYLTFDGQKIPYQLFDNIDYQRLKLFFVALLWRSSVSSRDLFSRVNVQPFEERLRQMIWNADPGEEDEFSIALTRFKTSDVKFQAILPPFCEQRSGIDYCLLYMADFIAYIKVDKRKTPDRFDWIILKPDKPLIVFLEDFLQSEEFKILKLIAKASKKF